MYSLIASPFLEQTVLVRPGSRGGALLPGPQYEELRVLDPASAAPAWLAETVREQWGDHDVPGRPMGDFLLVRQPSTWGYGKASWEINLGCNYDCKHCCLGLKMKAGMPWEDKRACLGVMAATGILFLQVTDPASCSSRSPMVNRPSTRTSCVRTGTRGTSA